MTEIYCSNCGTKGVSSESADFARKQSKNRGFRYYRETDEWKCPRCIQKEKIEVLKEKQKEKPKTEYKLPKVSQKRKERDKEYTLLRKEEHKKHPFCAMIGCTKVSTDCHHLQGRDGANMLDPTKWIFLCHEHHMEVENMSFAEAEALGMKISRHWSWDTKNDPNKI